MADTAVRGTGCYKCGRTGHWSRDCPSAPATKPSGSAAPSPVVSARAGSSYGSQTQSSQGYKRKEFPGGNGEKGSNTFKKPAAEKALPKPPRRMPKLTPDKVLSADGLGYVLEKIPQQVEIKGRGHEVSYVSELVRLPVHRDLSILTLSLYHMVK
jgi:TIMELESS-interacting protein